MMWTMRGQRWLLLAGALVAGGCATSGPAEAPMTVADLDGTEWQLVSQGGVPAGTAMSIRFEGAKVAGSGGCNRYFAAIEDADAPGTLRFGPIGATRMSCGDVLDGAEIAFLGALAAVRAFAVEDGRLILAGDGADDLVFETAVP